MASQGDPLIVIECKARRSLSPLLFCIAKEVINRSIILHDLDGKIRASGPRQIDFPIHASYTDDIKFF